ncbi:MAG: 30S ribosomal protein S20 [Desulfobacterota bacterium]|nr:30S ribosomal protein S20 [Thermodesulfobacteriota bacterium]
MATHVSALKRHRQSLRRRARNRAVKSQMKTAIKGFLTAVAAQNDPALIQAALSKATSAIATAASKGVLHKRTAARKISRLAKKAHAATVARA